MTSPPRRAWFALLLIVSSTLGGDYPLSADVPQLIRYQGTLVDANNVPIEGTVNLTFRLYEAATGGTAVWTETQSAIPVSRGVFNVLLGQVTPLTLTFEKDYWLSTQVNTDAEMSPRQRLTSVPYAYRAQVAEQLAEQPPGFQADTAGTLTTGLVAYWKLDESSGSRTDSKGTNTLADNNTVTQAAGKKGNAAQFVRANSEYLSIADNPDLSTGDIDFTVAAWVYLDTDTDGIRIMSKGGEPAGTLEWRLARGINVPNGNYFWFDVSNDGASQRAVVSAWGSAAHGVWHLIVAWHDAANDQIGIQVDGAAPVMTAWSLGPVDRAGGFYLGREESNPGSFWNGRIDEVGFWKRVLTAQERADLYNAGTGNTYLPGGFYVDSPLTGKRYRLVTEEVP